MGDNLEDDIGDPFKEDNLNGQILKTKSFTHDVSVITVFSKQILAYFSIATETLQASRGKRNV